MQILIVLHDTEKDGRHKRNRKPPKNIKAWPKMQNASNNMKQKLQKDFKTPHLSFWKSFISRQSKT